MYPKRCEYTPIMHQNRGINGVKRQKISGVVFLLLLHCLVRGVIGVRGVKTKGAVLFALFKRQNNDTLCVYGILFCLYQIILGFDYFVFGGEQGTCITLRSSRCVHLRCITVMHTNYNGVVPGVVGRYIDGFFTPKHISLPP